MRALAAYLTVILCCGFYKDKQLPAYLSLKSSSNSAFCKIFAAKNPYPITVRTEKRQNKADRKRFFRMRFPAAGTLRQMPDSLFRPLRFGRTRNSYRAAHTRKGEPPCHETLQRVHARLRTSERVITVRVWTDPVLCASGCDPARDARCLRTKPAVRWL